MTVPFQPAAQPGYRQMGGGYDAAIAAARGQSVPGSAAPAAPAAPQYPQTILGQPAAVAQPMVQFQEPGWVAPPQFNDPRFAAARQPAPVQQPAAQPAVDPLQYRLNDTRLPAHLQGRSIGEVVQIAEGLRNVHLQSLNQPQPVAQPAPVAAQPAQVPAAGAGEFDWRKPRESIADVVRNVLQTDLLPILAPALHQVQGNGIQQARNTVAAEMGDVFGSLEPFILESMKGITDARLLTNPQTWRMLAQQAVGQLWMRSRTGQPAPIAAAPVPQQQSPLGNPWMQPVPQQPPVQPAPNLNGFYSEQPNQGGPVNAAVTLSPAMEAARQAMGMSREDYIAWGGGQRGGAQ